MVLDLIDVIVVVGMSNLVDSGKDVTTLDVVMNVVVETAILGVFVLELVKNEVLVMETVVATIMCEFEAANAEELVACALLVMRFVVESVVLRVVVVELVKTVVLVIMKVDAATSCELEAAAAEELVECEPLVMRFLVESATEGVDVVELVKNVVLVIMKVDAAASCELEAMTAEELVVCEPLVTRFVLESAILGVVVLRVVLEVVVDEFDVLRVTELLVLVFVISVVLEVVAVVEFDVVYVKDVVVLVFVISVVLEVVV